MTVNIKGHDYVTVAERMQMLHASGKSFEVTDSEPIQMGDRWVWRCTVLIDGQRYMGSAEVHLNAKPGSADATDPMACAETSAIGRALGFANYGVVEGIASADELVRTQPAPQPPQPTTDSDDLQAVKQAARALGLCKNPQQWIAWKTRVLGVDLADINLTPAHIKQLEKEVLEHKSA